MTEYKERKPLLLEASGEEDAKPSVPSPVKEEEVLMLLAPSAVHRWPLDRSSVVFNVLILICRKMFFQVSLPCARSHTRTFKSSIVDSQVIQSRIQGTYNLFVQDL